VSVKVEVLVQTSRNSEWIFGGTSTSCRLYYSLLGLVAADAFKCFLDHFQSAGASRAHPRIPQCSSGCKAYPVGRLGYGGGLEEAVDALMTRSGIVCQVFLGYLRAAT
jgi:hypothetical protein